MVRDSFICSKITLPFPREMAENQSLMATIIPFIFGESSKLHCLQNCQLWELYKEVNCLLHEHWISWACSWHFWGELLSVHKQVCVIVPSSYWQFMLWDITFGAGHVAWLLQKPWKYKSKMSFAHRSIIYGWNPYSFVFFQSDWEFDMTFQKLKGNIYFKTGLLQTFVVNALFVYCS